jgi:hypothetical protein
MSLSLLGKEMQEKEKQEKKVTVESWYWLLQFNIYMYIHHRVILYAIKSVCDGLSLIKIQWFTAGTKRLLCYAHYMT